MPDEAPGSCAVSWVKASKLMGWRVALGGYVGCLEGGIVKEGRRRKRMKERNRMTRRVLGHSECEAVREKKKAHSPHTAKSENAAPCPL